MKTDEEKILLVSAMNEIKDYLDVLGYGFKAQVLSFAGLPRKKRILIKKMLKEKIELLQEYAGSDTNVIYFAIRSHKLLICWLDLFEKNKLKKIECYLVFRYFKYKIFRCHVENFWEKCERFLLFKFMRPTQRFKSSSL
ncbi:MAG: hypothetical protein ACK5N8_05725 [Alphaproteobacteria bacterium]